MKLQFNKICSTCNCTDLENCVMIFLLFVALTFITTIIFHLHFGWKPISCLL